MRLQSIILCAAATSLLTCSPANAERIADPRLGLTIDIPSDWSELPTTEVNKDTSGLEKDDPELAEAVRKHGFIPNHLFGRIPKPNSRFSATVNLSTQPAAPLKGQSDQQALLAFLTSSAQQIPAGKIVTAPEIVTLAGRPASHVMLTSTWKVGGSPIPITIEAWAFPKGSYFLVLGADYYTDPTSGDRPEVMQIVNSLKFTDSPVAGK